jgi:hypothetical protein
MSTQSFNFIEVKRLEENTNSMKNSFPVGSLLVGNLINKAGCSNYPTFGKIKKITPTGKYRIITIASKNIDSVNNWHDQNGSYRAIIPDITTELGKSYLATLSKESRYPILIGSNMDWVLYDESKEYANQHDNGD